jgi:hypothetical protein
LLLLLSLRLVAEIFAPHIRKILPGRRHRFMLFHPHVGRRRLTVMGKKRFQAGNGFRQ